MFKLGESKAFFVRGQVRIEVRVMLCDQSPGGAGEQSGKRYGEGDCSVDWGKRIAIDRAEVSSLVRQCAGESWLMVERLVDDAHV